MTESRKRWELFNSGTNCVWTPNAMLHCEVENSKDHSTLTSDITLCLSQIVSFTILAVPFTNSSECKKLHLTSVPQVAEWHQLWSLMEQRKCDWDIPHNSGRCKWFQSYVLFADFFFYLSSTIIFRASQEYSFLAAFLIVSVILKLLRKRE